MTSLSRRDFIVTASAASAGAALGVAPADAGANVPNYWCTWATQARTLASYRASGELAFPGDQGTPGVRDNLSEQVLFRERGGWARTLYPKSRGELNILLDDGWDVGYGLAPANCERYGSMILDPIRFPSFGGTPAARLAALVRKVKDLGWRGLGLWVAPQAVGETWGRLLPRERALDELKRKLEWCGSSGVAYLKVDWGARDSDLEYRRRMSELSRELAPGMLVEHCRTLEVPLNGVKVEKRGGRNVVVPASGRCEGDPGFDARVRRHAEELLKFSDVFRIYDMTEPIFTPQALERAQMLLRMAERVGGSAFVNVEDMPYLAAALGCPFGAMRAANWPAKSGRDVVCRHRRTGEVDRAAAWQRLAPPFRSRGDFPTRRTDATLTDSWTFTADDTWYSPVFGCTVPQSAPAVVTRGLKEFPEVADAGEGVPFVAAMLHPNGAAAVAALPRLDDERGFRVPAADVTVKAPQSVLRGAPLGVFGRFRTLSLSGFAARPKSVVAADLAGGEERDVSAACGFAEGRLVVDGRLLASISSPTDLSDPAALLRIHA